MKPVLSVITAFHNGHAINELFLESLRRCSSMPYKLVAMIMGVLTIRLLSLPTLALAAVDRALASVRKPLVADTVVIKTNGVSSPPPTPSLFKV